MQLTWTLGYKLHLPYWNEWKSLLLFIIDYYKSNIATSNLSSTNAKPYNKTDAVRIQYWNFFAVFSKFHSFIRKFAILMLNAKTQKQVFKRDQSRN